MSEATADIAARDQRPAYELTGVSFAYPARGRQAPEPVLRDVSLIASAGRLLTLIGPNGSGKTTLLRCMIGACRPSAGRVLLRGAPVRRHGPRQIGRLVGYVPQETHVAFDYSVLQVVLMGRSPHLGRFGFETPADLAVARECLRLTDTERFEDRLFAELSSGERQRVVIARALAQQPRILLLDEPTSFLDIGHQLQIYRLLARLAGDGLAVVCVSHDLNIAGQFSDEMVLLHEGRVVVAGPPDRVLDAATIGRVYGLEVDVVPHPHTRRPVVLPR